MFQWKDDQPTMTVGNRAHSDPLNVLANNSGSRPNISIRILAVLCLNLGGFFGFFSLNNLKSLSGNIVVIPVLIKVTVLPNLQERYLGLTF